MKLIRLIILMIPFLFTQCRKCKHCYTPSEIEDRLEEKYDEDMEVKRATYNVFAGSRGSFSAKSLETGIKFIGSFPIEENAEIRDNYLLSMLEYDFDYQFIYPFLDQYYSDYVAQTESFSVKGTLYEESTQRIPLDSAFKEYHSFMTYVNLPDTLDSDNKEQLLDPLQLLIKKVYENNEVRARIHVIFRPKEEFKKLKNLFKEKGRGGLHLFTSFETFPEQQIDLKLYSSDNYMPSVDSMYYQAKYVGGVGHIMSPNYYKISK